MNLKIEIEILIGKKMDSWLFTKFCQACGKFPIAEHGNNLRDFIRRGYDSVVSVVGIEDKAVILSSYAIAILREFSENFVNTLRNDEWLKSKISGAIRDCEKRQSVIPFATLGRFYDLASLLHLQKAETLRNRLGTSPKDPPSVFSNPSAMPTVSSVSQSERDDVKELEKEFPGAVQTQALVGGHIVDAMVGESYIIEIDGAPHYYLKKIQNGSGVSYEAVLNGNTLLRNAFLRHSKYELLLISYRDKGALKRVVQIISKGKN